MKHKNTISANRSTAIWGTIILFVSLVANTYYPSVYFKIVIAICIFSIVAAIMSIRKVKRMIQNDPSVADKRAY